ncbi:type II toxin-antitoxin system HipA family toxin YjjJ [Pelagicoccus sp. SDUM812005]|uniref:type II toxin-antitoxin system HipA family toxin YjjJ n=1 Tax=Pelagicoccus sp. SDUM812005 TaxID=3041257 RepID=UPI00280FF5F2|nr:type II toxin-antitoxin system HipA family toxin YjjJ [Pelagicoccus sp. SDUM812005]MDQ8182216.1 type II toxin-antitoxin system HipA family toxin YjjJ [Pelagicoccus sp. SDUM812005]
MSSKHTDSIERLLASQGSMSAADIARALGVSQPTVSRALSASSKVLHIGQTRRARYALPRPLDGEESNWKLYQIDASGQAQVAGTLHALHQGEFYFEPNWESDRYSYLLNGEDHPQLFPDLPWFLEDMRPQGYLGRLLAHAHGPALGIGTKPENWTVHEALKATLAHGDDTPGNFILGGHAIDAFLERPSPSDAIEESERATRFDQIAHHITEEGEVPNSSAGGEQPKFTACIRRPDDSLLHAIVKFSGSLQTDAGRRWGDLLAAEAIAAEELSRIGLPAANSQLIQTEQRAYLEVERFDRSGSRGRIGTLSLRSLIAGLGGELEQSWSRSCQTLVRNGWLSQTDADRAATYEYFGHLIGNSDMHLGNLSVFLTPQLPLELCPIYDMLPMRYAPQRSGDLPTKPIDVRPPRPEELSQWQPAAQAAARFWTQLTEALPANSNLRESAQENSRRIQDASNP